MPQIEQNLIFSVAIVVHELPKQLPNDFGLGILGNTKKISNMGGGIAKCPVSLPEIKLQQ